ncbi:putative manganese-dependent inorganic diphosphatase [Jutongia sp.]|uniref:putative manganese-dependent inorganic diphosphatase n=1 Tax=Jutongia sp. TaxID=2944204 RepID=UPI00307A246D
MAGEEIHVIGHINPDTDSVCSAIAYAAFKRQMTGKNYTAKRAGQINSETRFVLQKFGVPEPEYLSDVRTQVFDIDVVQVPGVGSDISLKRAWEIMKEGGLATLPVVCRNGQLEGLITIEDIAKSYMDVYDSCIIAKAETPFRNLIETLEGEMIAGDPDEIIQSGKCLIAAANPDLMENYIEKDDIVILGNRYESQLCAIEMGAKCIIVCDGSLVSFTIKKLAESKGCFIIKTPYDTYTATRLVNQSMPIRYFMKQKALITFQRNDYVDDIRETMAKKRYRDFPIMDLNGSYYGMISRRSLLGARKKRLVLVDHNEVTQAVDGLDEAEVLEVIDHHRIGSLETMNPVYFRNQPLGCTATIIYQMYREQELEISREIAGLLCSAILSDTLIFRSPTCTETDKKAAYALAQIAGIEPESYAAEMFAAGSNLSAKTPEEIFYQDFKKFVVNDVSFGVGQINSMTQKDLEDVRERMIPYMEKALTAHSIPMLFFMLTDILQGTTELLCAGNGAKELALEAFHLKEDTDQIILENTVSRKKQLIPALMQAIQQ